MSPFEAGDIAEVDVRRTVMNATESKGIVLDATILSV
jgi:hypothetical protein